jgi:hypothetical protein
MMTIKAQIMWQVELIFLSLKKIKLRAEDTQTSIKYSITRERWLKRYT